MLLPSISHKEIDTTAVHKWYWLHPLVLAVIGDIMLERAPSIRGLTLADSVPSYTVAYLLIFLTVLVQSTMC